MFDVLAGLLSFFYDLWPSYGGAIILFTLAIMLVLSPLSIKSTRSMIAMQRLSPELKRLQQKHKDDRETLNKEMMAFYQANSINPLSSCLPLLLQMPVFIVLYRVLTGLTNRNDAGTFEPKYLDQSSDLYQRLEGSTEMRSFGMDLSRSALTELQDGGILVALPVLLLVGVVVVTSFVQQRQIQGRNPQAAAAANPQQQLLGKIMPFIFIPISVTVPAGVVIYFAVQNLVRVAQQALITRLEYGDKSTPPDVKGVIDVADAPPVDTPSPRRRGRSPANGNDSPTKGKPPANGKATGKPPANGKVTDEQATDAKPTTGAKPTSGNGNGSRGAAPSAGTNGRGANGSNGNGRPATSGSGATSARSRKRKRK